ncbi:hypothetical protein HELRODRAFT_158591 [Helobdella robusta]|uniref:Uncharacterized protein n=1 Tax=Helobdella robusta TaxID=6412 RepID=T1EMZ6_HELRO|nr:hypothetical protein HELRODRAFT_158591 [Helobdella robusta]ESO12142.1 hypothetical protein HELRODRAFT_158591 [Helobdella robusta]
MPRDQKFFCKYKCLQPGCRKTIRQDKWSLHCRKDHGYMHARGSNNDMRKSDDDIGDVVAKEYFPTEAAESNSNVCDLIQSNNSNLNAHSLVEKNIENKFNYCENLNLALDKNDAAQFCGRILKRHEITTCLALGVYQPNDYSYPVTDGRSFQKE